MFRLSRRLNRTIAELERTLSSSEFTDQMAYDQLEPSGSWFDDYRALLICATLININRRKETKPVTPYDLMELLPWRQDEAKLTKSTPSLSPEEEAERQRNILNTAVRMAGGKIIVAGKEVTH